MTNTWAPVPEGSGFGIDNLPYGIFSPSDVGSRVGVRIGDHVLDLRAALGDQVFERASLNDFMARGRDYWTATRRRIIDLLTDPTQRVRAAEILHPLDQVTLHLPIEVADYVDFYASEHHATNLGTMFRPDSAALLPNWKHLPVGYHGRAGTIIASGTPVTRPSGQRKAPADPSPVFGPSARLDIEVEVGYVVGTPSELGKPVSTKEFTDHVFGVCLVNDWSARDIQAWEYVPLGPFLGKSFATSISPWIVPLDALAAARVPTPQQDPAPLPYLEGARALGFGSATRVRTERTHRIPATVRADVLVSGTDAFAYDGQRCEPAHR